MNDFAFTIGLISNFLLGILGLAFRYPVAWLEDIRSEHIGGTLAIIAAVNFVCLFYLHEQHLDKVKTK